MRTSDTNLTPAMRDAWFDVAMHLTRPLFGPDRNAGARRDQARLFWNVASDMEMLLPTGSPWSAEGAAKVAAHWYRVAPNGAGGFDARYSEQALGVVRCLAMAHAVASREPGRLGWFDARAVDAAMRDLPGFSEESRLLRARCLHGQVATTGMAEVPFRMPVAAAVREGAGPAPARCVAGAVAVARAAAEDAPVVARLLTPGEPVSVRRHAGRLIRPLQEPGAWRPLREGDLGEALSGMSAWRDDPFRDLGDAGKGAGVPTDDMLAGAAATVRGRRDAGDAAEAAAARLGPLVVVDGVVHRRTRRPRTVLAMVPSGGGGSRYAACWTTGDLAPWHDQAVAFPSHGRPSAMVLLGATTFPLLPPDLHDRVVAAWRAAGDAPAHGVRGTVEWLDPGLAGFDPALLRDGMASGRVVVMRGDDDPPGPGRWPADEVGFQEVAAGHGDLAGDGFVRALAAVVAELAAEREHAADGMAGFAP